MGTSSTLRARALTGLFFVLAICSGITSSEAATLFGVSGDGGSPAESLFTINTTNASTTFLTSLGNGIDGEEIAFNPSNGLLYHFSGRGTLPGALNNPSGQIMETINPTTLAVAPVTLTTGFTGGSPTFTEEVKGVTYNPGTGNFVVADLDEFFYTVTPTGTVTNTGTNMDHLAKGMAFAGGNLYSIDNTFGAPVGANLRRINAATGATIGAPIAINLAGASIRNGISLATDPDSGLMYAVLNTTAQQRVLATVDPNTGAATLVGALGTDISSIAFVPEPATLGLLAGLGVLALRRRG